MELPVGYQRGRSRLSAVGEPTRLSRDAGEWGEGGAGSLRSRNVSARSLSWRQESTGEEVVEWDGDLFVGGTCTPLGCGLVWEAVPGMPLRGDPRL
jgi:hypothetical protein